MDTPDWLPQAIIAIAVIGLVVTGGLFFLSNDTTDNDTPEQPTASISFNDSPQSAAVITHEGNADKTVTVQHVDSSGGTVSYTLEPNQSLTLDALAENDTIIVRNSAAGLGQGTVLTEETYEYDHGYDAVLTTNPERADAHEFAYDAENLPDMASNLDYTGKVYVPSGRHTFHSKQQSVELGSISFIGESRETTKLESAPALYMNARPADSDLEASNPVFDTARFEEIRLNRLKTNERRRVVAGSNLEFDSVSVGTNDNIDGATVTSGIRHGYTQNYTERPSLSFTANDVVVEDFERHGMFVVSNADITNTTIRGGDEAESGIRVVLSRNVYIASSEIRTGRGDGIQIAQGKGDVTIENSVVHADVAGFKEADVTLNKKGFEDGSVTVTLDGNYYAPDGYTFEGDESAVTNTNQQDSPPEEAGASFAEE